MSFATYLVIVFNVLLISALISGMFSILHKYMLPFNNYESQYLTPEYLSHKLWNPANTDLEFPLYKLPILLVHGLMFSTEGKQKSISPRNEL